MGQQYTVLVDSKVINQWDGAVPMSFPDRAVWVIRRRWRASSPPGYIGLQDHQDGDVVEYRDVRVKELAAAPRNTSAPVVTGDGFTGRPLTCAPGTWADVDAAQAYVIDWMRSNPPVSDAPTDEQMGNVKVATGATYAPTAADLGKVVWCRVTATNAGGATTWATKAAPAITFASDAPGTVGGSVPATLVADAGRAGERSARSRRASTKDYDASTTATVISTAGDAALTASTPDT